MAEVLPPASSRDSPPYFPATPLAYSPPSRHSLLTDAAVFSRSLEYTRPGRSSKSKNGESDSSSSSPCLSKSSLASTPPSSVSFDKVDDDGEDLYFPTYHDHAKSQSQEPPPSPASEAASDNASSSLSESTPTNESNISSPGVRFVADDTAIHDEPSRQVDYLSHDWREEDIWYSWKHIRSRRKHYGESSRLENASWRTWAKSKYRLKTVSPERLNWLKDCDVTWLYGPLQEAPLQKHASEPCGTLSKSNSFINKKPILKKRSVSEILLQKSLSTSSLVKQAAAAVQAQRSLKLNDSQEQQPLSRTASDILQLDSRALVSNFPSYSSSGLQSPESGRRRIRFDDNVEQCIAVDFQVDESKLNVFSSSSFQSDEISSSSEDDVVMINSIAKKPSSTQSSRRSSFGPDGNGIAMLPSTRLKYHGEESDRSEDPSFVRGSHHLGRLQPSSSQETLKPSDPTANFLIEDDVDVDMSWEPSRAFANGRKDGVHSAGRKHGGESGFNQERSHQERSSQGLRRTPSGMFMPFDEDEEEQGFAPTGVLGRVVDTVNTARDIMHVILNVGWRS